MKKIKEILIGILIGSLFTGTVAFADLGENIQLNEILEQIYVSFNTVKHIVIKDVEKTPPDDMKPFVYNGRTYVSLRYIGEALGENVNWDESTGTVQIGCADAPDIVKSYFNKLTDYDTLQKWDYFGDDWKIDGENGLCGKSSSKTLIPKINLPNASDDYVVEVDFVQIKGYEIGFAKANTADNDIKKYDYVQNYGAVLDGESWDYGKAVNINGQYTKTDPDELGFSRENQNAFQHLKIKVKNGIAEVYINDTYVNATKVKGSIPSVALAGEDIYKNLKVTIND